MTRRNIALTKSQESILDAAEKKLLNGKTLLEIGAVVGIKHPQTVKYHLGKLVDRGMLRIDKARKTFTPITMKWSNLLSQELVAIPIYGGTSAGEATIIAEQNLDGYMRVSRSALAGRNSKNLFALKVSGDSMNKANINGLTIGDGDYVLVEKGASVFDGDIVLSIIDGLANIKYFQVQGNRIILTSKSTSSHPPIVITEEDCYLICGKVVEVIKN